MGSADTSSTYGYNFGGASMRIRHMNTNLLTVTPPSISAGCAGIDFFAGSFSMINKDELIQMGRAIMQGAPTYAFGLALTSICPDCSEAMKELQKQLGIFNAMAGDTCQAAERFSDYTGMSSMATSAGLAINGILPSSMLKGGVVPDFGAGLLKSANDWIDGDSPQNQKDIILNNPLTEALKKVDSSWLSVYGLDSDESKGFVLALLGFSSNRLEVDADNPTGTPTPVKMPPILFIRDLIYGPALDASGSPRNFLQIYECKPFGDQIASKCLDAAPKDKPSWTGLKTEYMDLLLGDVAIPGKGLAFKFAALGKLENAAPLTPQDWAAIKIFPADLQNQFEIIGDNELMVTSLAAHWAETLAIKHGFELITELIKQVSQLLELDFSENKILGDQLKGTLPKRIKALHAEILQINSLKAANEASIANAVARFELVRKIVAEKNASNFTTEGH